MSFSLRSNIALRQVGVKKERYKFSGIEFDYTCICAYTHTRACSRNRDLTSRHLGIYPKEILMFVAKV